LPCAAGRTIDLLLPLPSSRAGSVDRTDQGDRGDPRALWLSAHSRAAAPDGWRVNAKRVYRLYRDMGLQLRHKTPKRRVKAKLREDRRPATRSNETWAMDFVHDQLATGTKLRVLTIIDTFSRFSPAIEPRFNFRRANVVEVLERVGREVGLPAVIRVDQGSEFVSRDLDLWAYQRGVTLDFSRPGKPTDNAFIESFNGKFRTECLNAHWFMSLDDARRKCEAWRRDYNEERPHSSIGNKAPIELVNRSAALARPDRRWLEKAQQSGPRIGSGSNERQTPIAAG